MANKIGRLATTKVGQLILGADSPYREAQLLIGTDGATCEAQVRMQNVAADMVEKSDPVRYPVLMVYCEKIVNNLREKFRTFSGTIQMAIEVRHSGDRLEGLEARLEAVTDAVTGILIASRGDWGDGMFYGGGYQVAFAPVKHGGRNFIQVAKVTFEIGASIN